MRDVIAVCRSSKKARPKVAAVLDSYLWRIGDRTWRGRASEACLRRISDDLKAIASKNMAVSVHDAKRHHAHQEPLFFVGSRRQFSETGVSPISFSTKARNEKVYDDHELAVLTLAAHFHDIGKGLRGFQRMISAPESGKKYKERFRHELLSAHILDLFTRGMSDAEALGRIAVMTAADLSGIVGSADFRERMRAQGENDVCGLTFLTPGRDLAIIGLVGLLVLTHHRLIGMRALDEAYLRGDKPRNGSHVRAVDFSPEEILIPEEARGTLWQNDKFHEPARRAARALMDADPARLVSAGHLHLRAALIFADRAGSRETAQTRCETGLVANTDRETGEPQDDVETHTQKVSSALLTGLKALSPDKPWPSTRASSALLAPQSGRFSWQTEAVNAAAGAGQRTGGVFGVLIAGTGSGKTRAGLAVVAAARRGELRLVNCLGLRTLAKQTASAYVDDGLLSAKDVKALIGGSILTQPDSSQADVRTKSGAIDPRPDQPIGAFDPRVNDIGADEDDEALGKDTDVPDVSFIRAAFGEGSLEERALAAPVLVCTVDHMIPASSPVLTKHIAATMRLSGSDVILDEVDQYSASDLVSLMRLIRTVGACGRNLFLMSATLTEDLAFAAYRNFRAGRREFLKRTGGDEGVRTFCAADAPGSAHAGATFRNNFKACLVAQRLQAEAAPVIQRVSLLPPPAKQVRFLRSEADATAIRETVLRLHADHHETIEIHGRPIRVSVGAIKMTRIRDVVDSAEKIGVPGSRKMCLHSSLPAFQRAMYERDLTAALNRKGRPDGGIRPWVENKIRPADLEDDLILMIHCSPVIETGNDIDLDWAVCEPHDARGLVQFAGRVNRHRREPVNAPNIAVMRTFWSEERKSHAKPGLLDSPKGSYSCRDSAIMGALTDLRDENLRGKGMNDLFSKLGVSDGGGVSPLCVHGDATLPLIERATRRAYLAWDGLSDLRDAPGLYGFSRAATGKVPFRGGPSTGASYLWTNGGWHKLEGNGDLNPAGKVQDRKGLPGAWLYDDEKIMRSLTGPGRMFRTMTTISHDAEELEYHPQTGLVRAR